MVGLAATFAFEGAKAVFAPFGIGLALFVMAGAVTDLAERLDLRNMSLEIIGRRAAGLPRSAWRTAVAHFALGVTLLGIVFATNLAASASSRKPSQTVSIGGYDLTFDGMVSRDGSNYRETAAHFTVRKGGTDKRDRAVEACLSVARRHVDHRGRIADARRQPAPPVARRQQRRRLDRAAAVSQAAGALDLARGAGDGAGRRAVIVGPPIADRRAEAGKRSEGVALSDQMRCSKARNRG
jgi:Cytochrome c-type biogenesis protein CcmF C-terminal